MKDKKDITVVLFTYNSSIERTLLSLKSAILQKDVDFEIIVSDDGSKDNNFQKIEDFFKLNNFSNYKLIEHKNNVGTVQNYLSAAKQIQTEYFKDLGQGDMFYDEYSLKYIVEELRKEKPDVMFTDSVYYKLKDNKFSTLEYYRYPQDTECYIKHDTHEIRRNYVVYDDIVSGATFVYKTDKLIEYLNLMKDVKYAEDNAVRLMATFGEKISYLNKKTILYEFGDGISTNNNNSFEVLLQKDWDKTDDIILDYCKKNNYFDVVRHIEYERVKQHSLFEKIKYYLDLKGLLTFRLKSERRPVLTETTYNSEFVEKCIHD